MLKHYHISARVFSRAIGVPDNNTQNYFGKNPALPKTDYLERVLHHFLSINPGWLLTGVGEPFLNRADEPFIVYQKNDSGQRIKNNHGMTTQQHGTSTSEEKLKATLEAANKKIALLRDQLAMKDRLIAAKDEMLSLFGGGHNQPN